MKNKCSKMIKSLFGFFNTLTGDGVGIYTAHASFFITLSIFPFIMLFLNVIGLTPVAEKNLISVINNYSPSVIKPLLIQITSELYLHASGTTISISALIAIWAASRGVLSVMFGLYRIYNVKRQRIYIISRLISMLYTVILLFSGFVAMVLLVFGNSLFNIAISNFPALQKISLLSLVTRYITSFIVLSLFFSMIFKAVNYKEIRFKNVIPGALFSSLGWIIFSYGFSIYVDNFSNMSYMYGSLTALIIMMLWIYFCIYILFIGAEINKTLHLKNQNK